MASLVRKQASPRRARNSLTRDGILDEAEQFLRSGKKLSIRGVASGLACSPMALYRHFPDKQSLLLALLDRVLGTVLLHEQIGDWEERLIELAAGHLRVLKQNSWAIPLLFSYPDPGPAVRKVGEAMLSAIKQSGASDAEAVATFSALLALNYGWAGFTSSEANLGDPEPVFNKLQTPPVQPSELPVTFQLWAAFEDLGSEGNYKTAIRKLISSPR